jgi:hypothetical protein
MGAYSRILLPWDSQPQEVVGVNGESPYAQNLVTCIPLHPQWGMRNLVTGAAVTKTGLTGTVVGPHGLYPNFGASSYCDFDSPAAITSGTQPVTIAWDQYPVATSAYSTVLNWKPAGATYAFVIYQSAAVAGYYFVVGARLSGSLNTASYETAIGAVTNARLDRYVVVCTGGINGLRATYKLFRNGVLQTQTGGTALGSNLTTSARIGSLDGGTDVFEGAIGNLCIWNEAFSDAKAAAYDSQRWQLFAPRTIWVPVSAAAGGAYTLTCDAGAYVISGQDAALLRGRVLTADAGAYALAGQDATLTYTPGGSTYTLVCDAGAYALAGQDAALIRGRVLAADAGAYVVAGQDATLTYALPNAYTITCEAGAYSLSGQDATIAFSGASVPAVATGGGVYPIPRRKTKQEIDADRKRLGILPDEPEPEIQTGIVEVPRPKITLERLIGKPAADTHRADMERASAAHKLRKRRQDDDLLMMM